MLAQFVKPYVKSDKNDIIDAEAIAEAATRQTFVAVKEADQVEPQPLHRIRDQVVGSRTRLINEVRVFSLQYRVPQRQGVGIFKLELPLE
ncbi:hypothetical protein BCCGELA001_29620 [Bradyrhizobium sp. CCGE-LA001]|nr:hypothetical protein BCCGELA001_29620 [Bradyrhizobium sp. CCGE-LA001]